MIALSDIGGAAPPGAEAAPAGNDGTAGNELFTLLLGAMDGAADAAPSETADSAAATPDSNALLLAMAMPAMAAAMPVADAPHSGPAPGSVGAPAPERMPPGLRMLADAAAAPVLLAGAAPAPAQLAATAPPAPPARIRSTCAEADEAGAGQSAPPAAMRATAPQASADRAPAAVTATAPADARFASLLAPAQDAAPLTLAGPAQEWRQPLREALGEHLQLQLERHREQAVIRLEPPNLGRIDIALRHSGGSLQVTLNATHGEVLRQLQAIGDSLRQDLAQRQYTDVAVQVGTAHTQADSEGRQRQQGREQQGAPGRALSEDNAPPSTFALELKQE